MFRWRNTDSLGSVFPKAYDLRDVRVFVSHDKDNRPVTIVAEPYSIRHDGVSADGAPEYEIPYHVARKVTWIKGPAAGVAFEGGEALFYNGSGELMLAAKARPSNVNGVLARLYDGVSSWTLDNETIKRARDIMFSWCPDCVVRISADSAGLRITSHNGEVITLSGYGAPDACSLSVPCHAVVKAFARHYKSPEARVFLCPQDEYPGRIILSYSYYYDLLTLASEHRIDYASA